jgi:hypothetical protein
MRQLSGDLSSEAPRLVRKFALRGPRYRFLACTLTATLLLAVACSGRTKHGGPSGSGGQAGGGFGSGGASGSAGSAASSTTSGTGGEAGADDAAGGDAAGGASGGTASVNGGTSNAGSSGTAGAGTAGAGGDGGTAGQSGAAGNVAGAAGLGGGGTAGMPAREPNWATWPIPNAVGTGLPNPHSYTELNDGTVQDTVTGLVWQKQVIGPETSVDWGSALEACELLEGDWRLPSIMELVSLLDVTSNAHYDPLFADLRRFNIWSSTEGTDSTRAWSTADASTYLWEKTTKLRQGVCVRGGSTRTGPHYEAVTSSAVPAVRDNFTGLVWQQGFSEEKLPFADVVSYCGALGDGFRAPSAKELYSLVDQARPAPKIDETYFPDTPSERFWSRDPFNGDIVWVVGFNLGELATYKDAANWVRCVR